MNTEAHHLSEEEIAICAEVIENGLYANLKADFRKHLEHCDRCANEVLFVRESLKDIEQLNIVEPSLKAKKSNIRPLYIIGALIAASLAIFFIFLLPSPINDEASNSLLSDIDSNISIPAMGNPENTSKIAENDLPKNSPKDSSTKFTAPVLEDNTLIAYQANDGLEQLCESFAGNFRGSAIKVISKSVTEYPSTKKLEWSNPDEERLMIEIYNNKADIILQKEIMNNQFVLENLSDGLYYWKLINEDYDLIFSGKINVKH